MKKCFHESITGWLHCCCWLVVSGVVGVVAARSLLIDCCAGPRLAAPAQPCQHSAGSCRGSKLMVCNSIGPPGKYYNGRERQAMRKWWEDPANHSKHAAQSPADPPPCSSHWGTAIEILMWIRCRAAELQCGQRRCSSAVCSNEPRQMGNR